MIQIKIYKIYLNECIEYLKLVIHEIKVSRIDGRHFLVRVPNLSGNIVHDAEFLDNV